MLTDIEPEDDIVPELKAAGFIESDYEGLWYHPKHWKQVPLNSKKADTYYYESAWRALTPEAKKSIDD